MKTSKDKAKELVEKYRQYTPADEEFEFPYAVECAKIAVDEIINSPGDINWGIIEYEIDFTNYFKYWKEVKNELNNML